MMFKALQKKIPSRLGQTTEAATEKTRGSQSASRGKTATKKNQAFTYKKEKCQLKTVLRQTSRLEQEPEIEGNANCN